MNADTIRAFKSLCNALDMQASQLRDKGQVLDDQDVGYVKVSTAALRDALDGESNPSPDVQHGSGSS